MKYKVEVDGNGCATCGAGRMWTVVGPDGIAEGVSFGREEDAADLADAMNRAYEQGVSDISQPAEKS